MSARQVYPANTPRDRGIDRTCEGCGQLSEPVKRGVRFGPKNRRRRPGRGTLKMVRAPGLAYVVDRKIAPQAAGPMSRQLHAVQALLCPKCRRQETYPRRAGRAGDV